MRRLRIVIAVALLATATLAAVRGAEAIVARDPAAPPDAPPALACSGWASAAAPGRRPPI